jgi:DNA-binding transcriptional MerR regulator
MNQRRYLRTSELAQAANVHPNTVRLYEQLGFLPPVERDPSNNYRRFTREHLNQMLLARKAMRFNLLGGSIRVTAYEVIGQGAAGDLGGALELAYRLLSQVQAERAQAEAAANYLERWVEGVLPDQPARPQRIGEVAKLLDVTIDQLRNWDRNRLLEVPRDPSNGYRLYGPNEIGRLRVIRILIRSRYSMMAILRVLSKLDAGEIVELRAALDTPEPGEDILSVTDHWLSTLARVEEDARELVSLIEENIERAQSEPPDYFDMV